MFVGSILVVMVLIASGTLLIVTDNFEYTSKKTIGTKVGFFTLKLGIICIMLFCFISIIKLSK